MNVCILQDEIINHPEHIETILERLGHANIKDRGRYYQARNINGDNDTGCAIRKKDLAWSNFSHNKSGDIWTMVQDEMDCTFPESLRMVSEWIGFKDDKSYKYHKPFKGFYESLLESKQDEIVQLPTYSESVLPETNRYAYKFVKDGIAISTQKKWGVRYDMDTDKIIIPWFNTDGDIIGAKWRNNNPNCSMEERWGMYIAFQKSQAVYGWSQNREYITKKRRCLILESEKSVMQCDTMGSYLGLAVGGHSVSNVQLKYINALFCKEIIIGFDGGLKEDEVRYEASKFLDKDGRQKVGYLYDKSGLYLKDKDSPTDHGIDNFRNIYRNCIRWIN